MEVKDYSDETISNIEDMLQAAQDADFISCYKLTKKNDVGYFEFDMNCTYGIISSFILCDKEGYQIQSSLFTDVFETEPDEYKILKVDKNNQTMMSELTKLICWVAKETNAGRFGIIYKTGIIKYTFPVFWINEVPSYDTIVQSLAEVKRIFNSELIEAFIEVIGGVSSAEEAYNKYHLDMFAFMERMKKAGAF